MDLVFNDLSSTYPASQVKEAREWMDRLIQVIRGAIKEGATNSLFTQENFLLETIGPSYRISDWMSDSSVDIESQRYWKSKVDRQSYIQLPSDEFLYHELYLYEFVFEEKKDARGMCISYLRNGLLLSFNSDPKWNTSRLIVIANQFDEKTGDIQKREIQLLHANDIKHIEEHSHLLNQKLQQAQQVMKASIKNGLDLANKVEELFPSLDFCNRVIAQLQDIQRGNASFQPIIKKLFELESYFSSWSGTFDSNYLNHCTPESDTNLNKYKADYTFECPDGEKQTFSWHMRFTPGAGRIFFIPNSISGKAIIGHIGSKIGD